MASAALHIDVFNGDADGLCALQQLRLAEPLPAERVTRVTGVKRHIRLLDDVTLPPRSGEIPPGAAVRVTVLDVSFAENRAGVERLLAAGAQVRYFDHHFAGEVPRHPALETHLDPSPRLCTSLLVDRYLGGAQRAWAVTGAFGDNLIEPAQEAAAELLPFLRVLAEELRREGRSRERAVRVSRAWNPKGRRVRRAPAKTGTE